MDPGLRWTDWALPCALIGMVLLELITVRPPGATPAGFVLVAAGVLLVWRRRWPLTIGVIAGVLPLTLPWIGPQLDDIVSPIPILMLACFALARWVDDLRGLAFLLLPALQLLGDYVFVDQREHTVGDFFWVAILLLPPYLFGRITRKLAVQAEQLEKQQELIKQAAVRDERDRIAREVHDVIAHSISAMVVQAAAAQELMNSDPGRAQQALGRVTETGRKAIAETGRLLHVIRDADNELGLAPTPGLRNIDELVTEFQEQGLVVELLVEADPDVVPAAVDVSVYRIAREALTNALRYSPDRRVRLEVLGTSSGLTLRATNSHDGRTGAGTGLGLAGLAERVDLLGGSLTHGPTGAGGYELVARLPLVTRELV